MRFSVAMNAYWGDDPSWFKDAVESVLNQTVRPDEIVIAVDGPVPSELDLVIAEYERDDLFHIVRFPQNMGYGKAQAAAFEACTNDLIARMDSDDLSVSDRFEKQLRYMEEHPDVDVVGANIAEFIGDVSNVVGYRNVPTEDADIKEFLKYRCPLNHVTVFMKKESVMSVGGYQEWFCDEDYFLWIRMFLAGMKFANLPEVLVNVRVGEEMYKRRGGWRYFKSEARLQRYMLKNKVIGFGTFLMNVTKRLILQMLMPSWLRGIVFKKFAREK